MRTKVMNILLNEDNPGDIYLTKKAFRESHLEAKLQVILNGVETIHYLKSDQTKIVNPILLNLNLPKKDGRQILKEIKNDPEFRQIPVVILTISKTEEDISRAYDLHTSCYITKPIGFEELISVVKSTGNF